MRAWGHRTGRKAGGGVALAAAFVFVLQSALGVFAATGPRVSLDAFGNPLCITSGGFHGVPDGGPASGHQTLPDCCTLGCVAAGGAFAAPEDVSIGFTSRPDVSAVLVVAPYGPPLRAIVDAARPRAPPIAG